MVKNCKNKIILQNLEALLLKDEAKSIDTTSDIVYIPLQKRYFMGHAVSTLLHVC